MKPSAVATIVVALLLLPILFMGALIAIADEDITPSDRALREIPPDLIPIYRFAAATCDGLEWTVLAAIHKVETNFGRGRPTSPKGAQGPMQFMPTTWEFYGSDGDGDGLADINNVADAIFSAAHLLCENGAGDPSQLATAIWNYNHSDSYVVEVLDLATSYGVLALAAGTHAAPSDLLNNPRVSLTSNARADLESGLVDSRLVALLDAISRRYTIGVGVFQTGHAMRTRSGSISNHYVGRAADITLVDGSAVNSANFEALQVVLSLAEIEGDLRPDELGHPFSGLSVVGGFSDADHRHHLHIGFD